MNEYVCLDCGETFDEPIMVDFGIGSYEFWGYSGTDENVQPASPCCEAEFKEADCDE